MELLRTYLNSLPTAEQEAYARRCGTTIGYLRKALVKRPKFDGALALALEAESDNRVTRQSLRPDIWPSDPASKKEAA